MTNSFFFFLDANISNRRHLTLVSFSFIRSLTVFLADVTCLVNLDFSVQCCERRCFCSACSLPSLTADPVCGSGGVSLMPLCCLCAGLTFGPSGLQMLIPRKNLQHETNVKRRGCVLFVIKLGHLTLYITRSAWNNGKVFSFNELVLLVNGVISVCVSVSSV